MYSLTIILHYFSGHLLKLPRTFCCDCSQSFYKNVFQNHFLNSFFFFWVFMISSTKILAFLWVYNNLFNFAGIDHNSLNHNPFIVYSVTKTQKCEMLLHTMVYFMRCLRSLVAHRIAKQSLNYLWVI